MSSRDLQDMSSRRLQRNNFSSSETSWKCLEDVLKTSCKMSSRRLQDVLEDVKLLRWRRAEDVFKTCFEDVFKTSSRPTNVFWEVTVHTVEVIISNQTELGEWEGEWGRRVTEQRFFLIAFLRTSWVFETFLHLIFTSSTYILLDLL